MNEGSVADSSVGQIGEQPSKFVGFDDSQYEHFVGGSVNFDESVDKGGGFLEGSFAAASESYVGGGGSVVAALWDAQSVYDNHPLKLLLADTQQKDIYYLPPKKKDKAKLMQRKIDAQKASRGSNAVKSTVKVSAARRVDSLIPKQVLKGKDAQIEQKLLKKFKGLDGVKAKKELYFKLEEKKEAARRKKILAKDPHAFDPPLDPDTEIVIKEEEGDGDDDAAGETFDLASYDKNIWADSGSAFVKSKEVRALRKVLMLKRWVAVVSVLSSGSVFCSELLKARLKRSAVAHLWGSDRTMHAVGAIQKAFFRFRHLKYAGATETADRLAARKAALLEGSLKHAGHEGSYEDRKELHVRRCKGADQVVLFLRDVHRCLSFKVAIRLFVNRIQGLQRNLRHHLTANKGRLEALTQLFDHTYPALINHFHVIDRGPGLDTPNLNRAEHAAVLRGLNAGLSKDVKESRVVREMRSGPSFHSFLRSPSTHHDRLHHISFQAKMAQGRVMTDAGGTLIDPDVRRRVLLDFIFRRRRVWVSELTRRMLHKGLENEAEEETARVKYASECYTRCHASLLAGDTLHEEDGEDEGSVRMQEEALVMGGAVDPQLVQRFLMSSPSAEDVVAIAMERRLELVDAAKVNYHAQKKQRQDNLGSQTIWGDFLPMVGVRDICLLFLEMERVSCREREERERAEKELARQRRKSSRRSSKGKRRGSVSLRLSMAGDSDSASQLNTDLSDSSLDSQYSQPSSSPPRANLRRPSLSPSRASADSEEISESHPKPPAVPKPSSLFHR